MPRCPNCLSEVEMPEIKPEVSKFRGAEPDLIRPGGWVISCQKCKYEFFSDPPTSMPSEIEKEPKMAECPSCEFEVEVPKISDKRKSSGTVSGTLIHVSCRKCKYNFLVKPAESITMDSARPAVTNETIKDFDAEAPRPLDAKTAKKSYLRDAISAFDKFVGEISEAERSETMIEIMKASASGKPIVEKYIKLASTVDWLVSEGFYVQITGRIENKDPWTAGGLPSEAKISGWAHETMPKIKSVIYPSPESYKKLEAAWSKKYGIGGENKISPDAVARMIAELELKEFEVFSRRDGTIDVRKALEGRVDSNMDGFIIRYEERKMYHFNGGYYLETSEK